MQSFSGYSRGFLLAPRSNMEILSRGFKAGLSLLFSQAPRASFMAMIDKGIINDKVFARADLGVPRMLTLFSDLESPTLKKYGFDAQEFMEGVQPALEQFHTVKLDLKNSLHTIDDDDNNSSKSAEEEEEQSIERLMSDAADERLATDLISVMGISRTSKEMEHLLKHDWKKEAEEKPDSLAGNLAAMVIPEFLYLIQLEEKTSYLLEKNSGYRATGGEVHENLFLLSARAQAMNDSDATENEVSSDVSEQELNPAGLDDEVDDATQDDKTPVAAQVEVLYTFDETFTRIPKGDKTEGKVDEGEENTRTSVAVGVFEGWLNGDPSGNKELRWRLSLTRPAWEFHMPDF